MTVSKIVVYYFRKGKKGRGKSESNISLNLEQSGTVQCTLYSIVHSQSFVVVVHNRCRELDNGYTYCTVYTVL